VGDIFHPSMADASHHTTPPGSEGEAAESKDSMKAEWRANTADKRK